MPGSSALALQAQVKVEPGTMYGQQATMEKDASTFSSSSQDTYSTQTDSKSYSQDAKDYWSKSQATETKPTDPTKSSSSSSSYNSGQKADSQYERKYVQYSSETYSDRDKSGAYSQSESGRYSSSRGDTE